MSLPKIQHPRPRRSGANSTLGEKTAENIHATVARIFGGRKIISIVSVVAALIVISGAVFWYERVYSNPENVFWGMISNNLSTYSVTKSSHQKSSSGSTVSTTQVAFSPQTRVKNLKDISATSNGATGGIKIESVGTPKDTYQHYVLIDQPAQPGKSKPDYSKVYPLWLLNGSGGQAGNSQLFSDAIFGGVLFGNMPVEKKANALNELHKAYQVNFSEVKKHSENGRKIYTYETSLTLKDYSKAARILAKSSGLPNADQINPDNYQASDKIAMAIDVDLLSRQVKKVTYKSSSMTEDYSGYGIHASIKTPAKTVDYSTLEKTVNKASSQ